MSNRPEVKVEGGEATFEGRTPDAVLEAVKFAFTLADWDMPVRVKMWSAGSTLDYKGLFWIWMREFAKQMTARGRETTHQELHHIFCHRHLGYTDAIQINKTTIEPSLRTITFPKQLERPEFYHFMRAIEDDAKEWGLTIPENNSQYEQDKAKEAA